MSRESLERVPALAASVALHVGVAALALMLGQWLNKPEPITQVTPVTLMNTADVAAAPPAMQADPTPSEACDARAGLAGHPRRPPTAPQPVPVPDARAARADPGGQARAQPGGQDAQAARPTKPEPRWTSTPWPKVWRRAPSRSRHRRRPTPQRRDRRGRARRLRPAPPTDKQRDAKSCRAGRFGHRCVSHFTLLVCWTCGTSGRMADLLSRRASDPLIGCRPTGLRGQPERQFSDPSRQFANLLTDPIAVKAETV